MLIITKSDLILRDIDIPKELLSAVNFTITTLEKEICSKLEPNTPKPEMRLQAIKEPKKAEILAGFRLDPIFPQFNDKEIEEIVKKANNAGVKHLVTSTVKLERGSYLELKRSV